MPFPGVDTVWKAFQHSLQTHPDVAFIGSRDPAVEGHPYKWKTWREVDAYVNELAAGY